jgi:hypothetical protein
MICAVRNHRGADRRSRVTQFSRRIRISLVPDPSLSPPPRKDDCLFAPVIHTRSAIGIGGSDFCSHFVLACNLNKGKGPNAANPRSIGKMLRAIAQLAALLARVTSPARHVNPTGCCFFALSRKVRKHCITRGAEAAGSSDRVSV